MTHPNQAGVLPPPELVTIARRYADRIGLVKAARNLGVGRSSLSALLAGLRVRRGTAVIVAHSLRWTGADTLAPPPCDGAEEGAR